MLVRFVGWSTRKLLIDLYAPADTRSKHSVLDTRLSPFPQIDIIGATVIVWRVRGKIIRSVLCNTVCNNCAQCDAHTHMNRPNSSLDWVLSHWAHFAVLRFIFVCIMCIIIYCVHVLVYNMVRWTW